IQEAFTSLLIIILTTLLLFCLLFVSFNNEIAFFIFGKAGLEQFALILLALLAIRTVLLFSLSYYRSRHRIVLYSFIQGAQLLGEVVVLFFSIVVYKTGFLQALEAMVVFNAVVGSATLISVLLQVGVSWPNFGRLKPYLMFSLPLIPNVSLQWIVNFSDRYVISHYIDLESVGIYAASYSLGQFVSFFITPIAFVLYPTISGLWEENKTEEIKYWIINSLKFFLILSIPAVFGIHYFAPFVLAKLASERFTTHEWLALLVAIGFLFLGIYQVYLYLMHLRKETVKVLIIFTSIAVLNLSLNFLLIPQIGIDGAALSTLISFAVQTGLVSFFAFKGFRVKLPLKFIAKSLFSAGIMFLFLIQFTPDILTKNIILLFSAMLIYFFVMFLTGAISKAEINRLRSLIRI
ncbi:MAG: oligosaccharide flippase family protein, partial [Calditrichae bacterium]|nr:oligosaccharide flippase family protein [Calditrichia bacterium]